APSPSPLAPPPALAHAQAVSVDVDAGASRAQAVAAFVHAHAPAAPRQRARRGEAGKAGTDDLGLPPAPVVVPSRRSTCRTHVSAPAPAGVALSSRALIMTAGAARLTGG